MIDFDAKCERIQTESRKVVNQKDENREEIEEKCKIIGQRGETNKAVYKTAISRVRDS